MKSPVQLSITALLILLFTYAAVSKLVDFSLFRSQLYLQPFPHALADLLVFAVPATEIIAIVLLCTDRTRFAGFLFSVGLLAIFTGYIAIILLYWQGKLPCSCGGILNHFSWSGHLVFNCIFIATGIVGVAMHKSKPELTP